MGKLRLGLYCISVSKLRKPLILIFRCGLIEWLLNELEYFLPYALFSFLYKRNTSTAAATTAAIYNDNIANVNAMLTNFQGVLLVYIILFNSHHQTQELYTTIIYLLTDDETKA